MSGDLESKLSVAALMEDHPFFRSFDRQAAKDEGAGAVDELLLAGGVRGAGHFNGLGPYQLALGNNEVSPLPFQTFQDVAGLLHLTPLPSAQAIADLPCLVKKSFKASLSMS